MRSFYPGVDKVLQMFLFANLSRAGVIAVTARKPGRDFNSVFAKLPLSEEAGRDFRPRQVFCNK